MSKPWTDKKVRNWTNLDRLSDFWLGVLAGAALISAVLFICGVA